MNKKYFAAFVTTVHLMSTLFVSIPAVYAESFDTEINILQANQDNVTIRAEVNVVTTADIAFAWQPFVCNSAGDITLPLHTNNTNPSGTEITSYQSMDYLIPESCLIRSNTSLNTVRIVSDDPTYSAQLLRQVSFSLPPTTSGTALDVRDTNADTTAVWVDVTYIAGEDRDFDATIATCSTAGDITIPLVTVSSVTSGQQTNVFGELVGIDESCLVRDGNTMNTVTVVPDDAELVAILGATTQFTLTAPPISPVHLVVRYQDRFLYDDMVTVPYSTSFQYGMYGDSNTYTTTTVRTVLSALFEASAQSPDFEISEVYYFSSYNSFLINCLSITGASDGCGAWRYVVNTVYPSVGMDKTPLNGGEIVNIYFAETPFQLTVTPATFELGTPTTFQTLRYSYDTLSDAYVADGNTLVEISVPNPLTTGWWDATIPIDVTTTDQFGNLSYLFSTTGTYFAHVSSTDFSKWSPDVTITVNDPTVVAPPVDQGNTGGNGGGGGSPAITHQTMNVDRAIEFLRAKQQPNGSILNSGLYTDWTAIAFGAYSGTNSGKEVIKQYLLTDPDLVVGFNETTDYARRSMALLALGINPYSGTPTNYIEKLLSKFDGNQFGETALVNDDIFALFPLLNAGYSSTDPVIVSTSAYIVSKQQPNGSWSDIDQTSAAIQALSLVPSLPNVTDALTKAKNYLHAQQQSNGSFGDNLDSTSWGRQAVSALGETDSQWTNAYTLNDYLAGQQQSDGGIGQPTLSESSRTWSTAYAITAALAKTWDSILVNVNKPAAQTATPPVSGSSPVTATTTPSVIQTTVTSTPAVVVIPVVVETTEFDGTGGPVEVSRVAPVGLATPTNPIQAVLSNTVTAEEDESSSADVALATDEAIQAELAVANQPAAETISKPMSPVAKGAVAVTATAATSLGLYLAWKFLQGLV